MLHVTKHKKMNAMIDGNWGGIQSLWLFVNHKNGMFHVLFFFSNTCVSQKILKKRLKLPQLNLITYNDSAYCRY